jgi:hypothetical protein
VTRVALRRCFVADALAGIALAELTKPIVRVGMAGAPPSGYCRR